ncbi:transposable element Tcb2 transposase [Trichonephila clavipes]|uniref:Transposable element Tcb2 transposase n=1 Tax=Trichonephila clavipes TaxID=2585209 RepID=A0A8X7BAR8_TRICX|nr:transposable element Tcb2 transposase [Trichonephila clavipes]
MEARVKRNSSTVMRVWKQWTDEHRTTRKTGSGRRKVTSVRDDHLLRKAVNDRTASSRQLAARWSTDTGVLISVSSIHRRLLHRRLRARCLYTGSSSRQAMDGCVCNGLMSTEPVKLIDTKLSFQRNHATVCGTMTTAFVLDAMPVNAAFQSGYRTTEWPNTQSHGIPGVSAGYCTPTCCKDCSAQHMQLLPWPAYSLDISPIEHVWDLVCRRLARDPRPAASKDELLLRIQAIWNSLPQADIQNLFDSMPCCITTLIAERGGYTKY